MPMTARLTVLYGLTFEYCLTETSRALLSDSGPCAWQSSRCRLTFDDYLSCLLWTVDADVLVDC